jgi:hypothetical protein
MKKFGLFFMFCLVAAVCTSQDKWHAEPLPKWATDKAEMEDVEVYSVQYIAYWAPELNKILFVNRIAWTYLRSNVISCYALFDGKHVLRWVIRK